MQVNPIFAERSSTGRRGDVTQMYTAIRWFAGHPASNLLMVMLIASGYIGALISTQEEFPNVRNIPIRVTMMEQGFHISAQRP